MTTRRSFLKALAPLIPLSMVPKTTQPQNTKPQNTQPHKTYTNSEVREIITQVAADLKERGILS